MIQVLRCSRRDGWRGSQPKLAEVSAPGAIWQMTHKMMLESIIRRHTSVGHACDCAVWAQQQVWCSICSNLQAAHAHRNGGLNFCRQQLQLLRTLWHWNRGRVCWNRTRGDAMFPLCRWPQDCCCYLLAEWLGEEA